MQKLVTLACMAMHQRQLNILHNITPITQLYKRQSGIGVTAYHFWWVDLAGSHDATGYNLHHTGSMTRAQGVKMVLKALCMSANAE